MCLTAKDFMQDLFRVLPVPTHTVHRRAFYFMNFCYYRPQTKFAKVMFLQVSVCPQSGGGACVAGGHAWQWACVAGGACMVGGCAWQGGMHGGGHAWQGWQGVHGRGAYVADTTRYGDTVNERAVRILLECILVFQCFMSRITDI